MGGKAYDIKPEKVERIKTPFRQIVTDIPAPESIPILEKLRKYEPFSTTGQPPIVWDRAENFQIYDKYGNKWVDWSSGVLVVNSGHGRKEIGQAIMETVEKSLLFTYFPNEYEAKLAERLVQLAPKGLDKVFLLVTGAEAIENTLKVSRQYGQKAGGKKKIGIISFSGAFHGRTLGAQMIGGIPSLKNWIGNLDPAIYILPFPNCFRCPCDRLEYEDCANECFSLIEKGLDERKVAPEEIAGVITESYQGGEALFAPKTYIQLLADWCRRYDILLIFDEVQAGFGRTGKWFAFEHYDVVPNLIACGKGITSSLPLSCVIGESSVMDLFLPGEMTSTHAGNPVCCAAALANIELLIKENLVQNAHDMDQVMHFELQKIKDTFPHIGYVQGKGLAWAIHMVKPGTRESDPELAYKVVIKAIQKGLMITGTLGPNNATIKMMPPLTITREAIQDGTLALHEAIQESI